MTVKRLLAIAVAGMLVALPAGLHFGTDIGRAEPASSTAMAAPEHNEDLVSPHRHFRVRDDTNLDADTARAIYDAIGPKMADGYALADDETARSYRRWDSYNTSPYRSATHGRRYVNNYANDVARDYGKFEAAGILPQGSVLAKDSFTVSKDSEPMPGPLFVMEKMAPGFSYVSGDWRYSMIMPDGSLFGVTNGDNSERVEFCIGCHLAREKNDHLFFVPQPFRQP